MSGNERATHCWMNVFRLEEACSTKERTSSRWFLLLLILTASPTNRYRQARKTFRLSFATFGLTDNDNSKGAVSIVVINRSQS